MNDQHFNYWPLECFVMNIECIHVFLYFVCCKLLFIHADKNQFSVNILVSIPPRIKLITYYVFELLEILLVEIWWLWLFLYHVGWSLKFGNSFKVTPTHVYIQTWFSWIVSFFVDVNCQRIREFLHCISYIDPELLNCIPVHLNCGGDLTVFKTTTPVKQVGNLHTLSQCLLCLYL